MALCSIVKVDVVRRSRRGAAGRRCARPKLQGALLVATDVADHAGRSSAAARSASPTSRASTSPSRAIFKHTRRRPPPASARCAALGELTAGDISFEDLERIISSDIGLSLKLLRYVNSAFFALPRTICSVREALHAARRRAPCAAGRRSWRSRPIPGRRRDELVALAPAPRAHVRDARRQRAARGARDAVHDRPVLRRRRAAATRRWRRSSSRCPFSEEIQAALLRHEGPKGELLAAVHRLRARRVPDAAVRPRTPPHRHAPPGRRVRARASCRSPARTAPAARVGGRAPAASSPELTAARHSVRA